MSQEEEEPKIYFNNRTGDWAVVGRVEGVVKVLTKEQPNVETSVIPDWVREAMKEEEVREEVGEEVIEQETLKAQSAPMEKVSQRKGMVQSMKEFLSQSSLSKVM